jgi:hypothetical protein
VIEKAAQVELPVFQRGGVLRQVRLDRPFERAGLEIGLRDREVARRGHAAALLSVARLAVVEDDPEALFLEEGGHAFEMRFQLLDRLLDLRQHIFVEDAEALAEDFAVVEDDADSVADAVISKDLLGFDGRRVVGVRLAKGEERLDALLLLSGAEELQAETQFG